MVRKHIGATLTAAMILTLIPGAADAVRVDYTLDFDIERNDNVLLTQFNPVRLTILRPGLGFSITQNSSTWQAEIIGRTEFLYYGDSRFDNTFNSLLNGRINWVMIPERLSFTAEDRLALQPVNTLALDVPGNRQQVNVFTVGPTLLFNWTPTLRGAAELRYINTDAEITDQFNSGRVNLALRTTKQLSPTSNLIANVQAQRVDFTDDIVARDYDRYDGFARYTRTLANFDLGIDAGYSRLAYRRGGGTRNEPLLRADVGWQPSPRNRLALRATSQFSDAAIDVVGAIDPNMTVPGSVPIGTAVVNASPFVERRVEVRHTFTSPRLTTVFAPYYNRLRYVDSNAFDQNGNGALADLRWLIRPQLRIGAGAALERIDYVELARKDRTRRYNLYLERDWSRHWSSRIELLRYERTSTEPGVSATRNQALLSFIYRNR